MKRFLTIILTITILAACKNEKEESTTEIAHGKAIVGLASPVILNYGDTEIHLLDYFENAGSIDTAFFMSNGDFYFQRDSALLHVHSLDAANQVTNLRVVYDGIDYDIPVFKSRRLAYSFVYQSPNNPAEIGIKGNMNGWNYKATMLQLEEGKWKADLVLNPGLYEYLIVEDGNEMLDPSNPDKKDNGSGGFNSTFRVGSEAKRPSISCYGYLGDSLVFHYPKSLNEPLVYWDNHSLDDTYFTRRGDMLSLALPEEEARKIDRSFIRVFGSSEDQRSNDILVPIASGKPVLDSDELSRMDKHTYAMYFMMVDRFVNGNESNDLPVDDPEILPPANYYGGDIAGVKTKVSDGYLKSLGMNTVWLSPIAQNPLGAYGLWDKGGVRSKFSGYHGYWPISSSKVDFRFGTDQELKDLISEAHSSEMNIILDYVANHVHEEHPVYQEHPDWATELYLPDGSLNTERWDEYRLTTWFDTFMPTLDLRRADVTEAMTDSALYWFEEFPIDGFRHDATKHIPLSFWRELTRKLKYRVMVPDDRAIYQIGETYGNPDLISSYVSSGMLDGQFDFNLYDAAVSAFAKDEGNLKDLERVLSQSLTTYGSHHLMGNISGNQDRTRFISFADGSVDFSEDYKLAGWTREITISDTIGYDRLALLHAFNFSVPGIPVIYYGDEIGLPGANDPDNRRMMRFGEQLDGNEKALLEVVSKVGNLRQNNMALLYGDTEVLHLSEKQMVFIRNYFDSKALVCINISQEPAQLDLQIGNEYNLDGLVSNFGQSFSQDGQSVSINLAPVSFEILTN